MFATEDDRKASETAKRFTLDNWNALGVVDGGQHGPLLPASLKVRKADGTLDEKPLTLMLLDGPRRAMARTRARAWAASIELEPNRDTGQDRDLVKELESFEELAYAIRDTTAHHDQMFKDGQVLWQAVRHQGALHQLYLEFDHWTQINDPRFGDKSAEALWETAASCHREGSLLPLAGIDGRAQSSFIMLMVVAALSSPMAPSGLRSRSTTRSRRAAPGT